MSPPFHVGGEQTWGIQFHPEVYHSTDGTQLLKNFVVDICGCGQSWTSEGFVEATVRELREKLGDDKVVLALSGGVDSSVAAVLLHKAIGKNLYCVFRRLASCARTSSGRCWSPRLLRG